MTAKSRTICSILLLSLAALLCPGAQAQPFPPPPLPIPPATVIDHPLTVDEAVCVALQYNPSITLAGQNVAVAHNQLNSARASVLPAVGLTVGSNYFPGVTPVVFGGQTVSGFAFTSSAQIFINQPIYPFTRLTAPVQSAKANVGITRETLARTQQQVVYQTRQAYYQLLIAQNLLNVAQFAVQVAQGQVTLAQATFNAGTAPRLDILQAQSTLENANLTREGAQNSVDVSRATLATQLGFPAGTPIQIASPTTIPVAPQTVEPLVQQALVSRPDLILLNYRRRQLKAALDLTRVEQSPTVNLTPVYTQILTGGSALQASGASIGLNVAFTLFDWGRARADVKAAKIQLAEVDTNARQLAVSTTLDVRSAWLNLLNAAAQLTSAEKQFEAANEALRISEVRYRAGIGIYLELQQAYLNATQALTSFSQATFQAQSAAAQLEFAVGAPVLLAARPIPALTLTVPPPIPAAPVVPAPPAG